MVPKIRVADIDPDPNQPRKHFDSESLAELAESIKAVGVHTPITVRKHPELEGRYMIISGERRFRASRFIGAEFIPAVVYQLDGEGALSQDKVEDIQLIENIQREGLNVVERAEFIEQKLVKLREQGVEKPLETVARSLGKSVSWVSKNTQVLKYEPRLRVLARDGKVKDYNILKKVDALSPEKKNEAIGLIEQGQFVASQFFKRKRYDKPDSDAKGVSQGRKVSLSFSAEELIRLIEKTEYRFLLDRVDEAWRLADKGQVKSYGQEFKKWVLDSCAETQSPDSDNQSPVEM